MEMNSEEIEKGERVVIVDDMIEKGGKEEDDEKIMIKMGEEIVEEWFIIEMKELGGRKKMEEIGMKVRKIVEFEGDWG